MQFNSNFSLRRINQNCTVKVLPKVTSIGLLFTVLMATSSSAVGQTATANTSIEQPNIRLNVERKSGNCPASVGMWVILLPLEGGADHIVVADTRAIAQKAKITRTTKTLVEYAAPLQPNYISCVGQASSPQMSMYSFQFRNRQVYFRVNLSGDGYREIVAKQLATERPYVFWKARE